MKNNDQRFRLPYGTALLNDNELHHDLGYLADTDAAKKILLGTYIYPRDVDPTTISVLKQFATMFQLHKTMPFNFRITTSDYVSYWKSRKEATASSFSGLHLGHYKAAADSPFLASIHAKAIELAYRKMNHMQRWSVGLSVMIEKEPGVIKVDKLRALLFMEADFNFANMLYFGKRMTIAANKQLVTREQFAVKNNTSVEVALCRMLFFDLVRLRQCNSAL